MSPLDAHTNELWTEQDRHPGDRLRLFEAVSEAIDAMTVLYPGSFVDISPSFVFDEVTYVDTDRRAARFFGDVTGVNHIIADHRTSSPAVWRFLHADYTTELGLESESFDLLVSLYAGFVSEHCARYLRRGGWLLVNPSHGDAAMASLDAQFSLAAVIHTRSGRYAVTSTDLHSYLQPKQPIYLTAEMVRERRRGIGYTRSAYAYLFEKRTHRSW